MLCSLSRRTDLLFHLFTRFFGTKALHADSQCSFISNRSELDGKFELFGRDPDPVITQGWDPDPGEHNDHFNFSLVFLAQKHCMSTHNAHLFPIEVNWTVNSNYLVGIRIPSSRKVGILIPTNITIISSFHSSFWHKSIACRLTMPIYFPLK